MSNNEIWYHFFGQIDESKQSEIINTLSNVGLHTIKYNPEYSYKNDTFGLGLIFFENSDPLLQNFLHKSSQQGLHYVIAIAVDDLLPNKVIWELIQCGAADAFSLSRSNDMGNEIAARFKRWQDIDGIIESPFVKNNLIGKSRVWIKTLRQIIEIGRFTDVPILITGESGTGKELVARLIHNIDERRNRNSLVVLDCTTVVQELSGSEFFGHERGAFTGAVAQREGAFALADGGTLFLDEVGELPLKLQAELLRVVQELTYKRVGGNTWQRTDFRLICATNRNLLEQEERGNFRSDFYHRIATWTCHLPPLRNRVEDILPLSQHFLAKIYSNKEPPSMDHVVCEYLIKRDYPGNVRELNQLIRRIASHHVGDGPVTAGDIPECDRPQKDLETTDWQDVTFEQNIRRAILLGIKLKDITNAAEETAERIALSESNGKVPQAAKRLGINERTLQIHVKENNCKLKNSVY